MAQQWLGTGSWHGEHGDCCDYAVTQLALLSDQVVATT
jgi:hypothetical protein